MAGIRFFYEALPITSYFVNASKFVFIPECPQNDRIYDQYCQ